MGKLSALALAGLVSAGAVCSAAGADLLPPPPPPAFVPPPADFGGWYLRGDVGAGLTNVNESSTFVGGSVPVPNFAYNGTTITDQAIIGGGVGYQFNSWFRADVTGEYRFGAKYTNIETATGCGGPGAPCADLYHAKINNGVFLANGYVDLGTWYGVTPYVGAGVGVAVNTISGLHDYNLNFFGADSGAAPSATKTNFAYAFMAGLSYALTPNLKFDVGYRYLDMGRTSSGQIACYGGCGVIGQEVQRLHLTSNDIRVGLRYSFADAVPFAPPPPPPLIRKY